MHVVAVKCRVVVVHEVRDAGGSQPSFWKCGQPRQSLFLNPNDVVFCCAYHLGDSPQVSARDRGPASPAISMELLDVGVVEEMPDSHVETGLLQVRNVLKK